MNDVLLLAVLQSLADGDTDTAREIVGMADDREAVSALLGDDVSESVAGPKGPPPFPGAVFDSSRHRWVKPNGAGGGGAAGGLQSSYSPEMTRDEYARHVAEKAVAAAKSGAIMVVTTNRKQWRVTPDNVSVSGSGKLLLVTGRKGGKPAWSEIDPSYLFVNKDDKFVHFERANGLPGMRRHMTDHAETETGKRNAVPDEPLDRDSHETPRDEYMVAWQEVNPDTDPSEGLGHHRSHVEFALAAGQNVPPEVLADYPDLVAKYKVGEGVTEAVRSGLILAQVGTHPRTGKPVMRWVRPVSSGGGSAAVKPDAKGTATRLIRDGVKTAADAKLLADSLKKMTSSEIDGLKREFAARTGGRLKQEKVDRLVSYARGRGSVTPTPTPTPTPTQPPAVPPPPTVTVPPTPAELESAVMGEVSKGLSGKHAAMRMVPIHEVRDSVKARYPDMTDDNFDATLLDMRRRKVVRLVSIDDRSRATAEQLAKSVYAVGETFFYIERV